jgi:hypothetical protein
VTGCIRWLIVIYTLASSHECLVPEGYGWSKKLLTLENKVRGFDLLPDFADQPHFSSAMQGLPSSPFAPLVDGSLISFVRV